jgi:hypothetical protein
VSQPVNWGKKRTMTAIGNLSSRDVLEFQKKVLGLGDKHDTLADAAQEYVSILYEQFKDSVVLTRLFATIPLKDLPEANRESAVSLARANGMVKQLKEDTLVLSLLGSRGARPEWNDRRASKGHVGIPLASSDFVDRIPMISRLLSQLGAGIDWIDRNDTQLVSSVFKSISGVFYVNDAATETDSRGRRIISAQDFVEKEGVKTVFGIGGCYVGTSLFFANIVFLREYVKKGIAEQFMSSASKFKIATMGPVVNGRILG